MNDGDAKTRDGKSAEEPHDSRRLEPASHSSDSKGRSAPRSSRAGLSESHDHGDGREHAAPLQHPVRDRHPSGIPGVRDPDPSEILLQAFYDGDVETAYAAAKTLQEAYHEALAEASRLRFRVNFGTERCNTCTGLHAGPGVLATCFQVKRCDFTHIKEATLDIRRRRILEGLTRRDE